MHVSRWIAALLLPLCLGCQTPTYSGVPAELCNTPGRQALAGRITDRGGRLVSGTEDWDNSVDRATKEKLGQPLAKVVLPQDRFNNQDIDQAKATFPEAQISTPLTLDDAERDDAEPAVD